ncbi:hypothetical protein NC651_030978 [Populus alba x Populus x berolinensis]|nr:hypothetical protein NC651_030978 [Populus alba x Populus x berolinensis]
MNRVRFLLSQHFFWHGGDRSEIFAQPIDPDERLLAITISFKSQRFWNLKGRTSVRNVYKSGPISAIISWFPPKSHVLKRNVDGSSIGKPRLAGIGGVLHNHKGLVLGFFSAPVGIKDSNEAELLDFLHLWTRCLSLMFRAMLTIWVMVLQNKHDVFLISSKAIKFNPSTTLSYTEARALSELALQVFKTL